MKTRNLITTTILLAMASTVSPVYGALDSQSAEAARNAAGGHGHRGQRHDKRHGPKHDLEHKVNRMFNALDTDASDSITLDEWLVKPAEKAAHQFDRIDADNDELVSLEEFLAIGHDRRRGAPDDIDRDEVRACVSDAVGEDVPERPEPETAFSEIDVNGDGFIDGDEYASAKTEKATARFNHIDADGDGAITMAELAEALSERRSRRQAIRQCVEDQRETDDLIG